MKNYKFSFIEEIQKLYKKRYQYWKNEIIRKLSFLTRAIGKKLKRVKNGILLLIDKTQNLIPKGLTRLQNLLISIAMPWLSLAITKSSGIWFIIKMVNLTRKLKKSFGNTS
ncbi:hypothetical protein [Bartonella sp. B39]